MEQRRILLVEDNPADIRLTEEVVRESGMNVVLDIARDGEQAMAFLRGTGDFSASQRPDIVLLDLNLPRKDGREVLAEIKQDDDLCTIPVIMLTTSKADHDISYCYAQRVNSYIAKPVDLDEFVGVIEAIENYWLNVVQLPPRRT